MSVDPTTKPHPWLAEIEQGRADAAAGRTVDLDKFIAELEAEDAVMIHELHLSEDGTARRA